MNGLMARKSLVIVESPTKAKTIRKFLPKSYVVEASMGHVRDLPDSASEIPAKYKKEEWAKIGVNVEQDFEPLYVTKKTKIVTDLKKKLADADELFLATDEDREGESIAWHLVQILKPKIPVKRMVFHEITKAAIEKSLGQTRKIDEKLVRAQETRRILDRLYGYTLSPLIWKKIAFGLSAGRVQSVALRLIVDRERHRLRFKIGRYWDLSANLSKGKEAFVAKLNSVNGIRVATGKDFDENTGELFTEKSTDKSTAKTSGKKELLLLDEKGAQKLLKELESATWKVESITEKPLSNRPSPPFITSTLQQEANRKLGLTAKDAMRTAQKLYEEGLITYMRTDSPNLSQEAIQAARKEVVELYGKEYLSDEVRQYTSKSKGAQEAHEAIRPAGSEFVHPKDSDLKGVELALYELIWKRTMATQMAEAKKLSVSIALDADGKKFTSSGTRILFAGFLRAYVEGSDDPDAALEDKEVALPQLKEGEKVNCDFVEPQSHETKPPARFTEAALVQTLEKEGIGRPSTYASIIGTIVDRGYVRKVATSLVPTFTGLAVTQILEKNFANLVDPKFTSTMEKSLDEIADGELEWLPYLKKFYLGKDGLQNQVKVQEKAIDPEESRTVNLHNFKNVQIRVGRFGAYIVKKDTVSKNKKGEVQNETHATIPEDIAPGDLKPEDIDGLIELAAKGPQPIGVDPKSGKNIYCLVGRFGAYVQLGEVIEGDEQKPRRASLPKGIQPTQLTVEKALELLSLPRELGIHPVKQKPVLTNQGRFGPYVMCDGDFRSLKKEDNVYTVTFERAMELLNAEKQTRRGSTLVKELGPHPKDKKVLQILDGKYGMYLKHGATNMTLPKDMDPQKLSIEEAIKLLGDVKKTKKKK